MFPFSVAKKLPVYVYEWVKFSNLSGQLVIDAPVKRGMIGIGQRFEKLTRSKGAAEIAIHGILEVKGHVHIGRDVSIFVGTNAYCEMGHMTCIGSNVKIICIHHIALGTWARIGFESQIIDTNSHQMLNVETGEKFELTAPIHIGNFNSVSNRVTFMPNTYTPDYCVIASNTLCNKDYRKLGNNVLLGGIPAKLLKTSFGRDWEGEKEMIEENLIVKW